MKQNTRRPGRRAAFEALEDRRTMTVKIVFDYSLDTAGFFNDPVRRDLLDYAGQMVASRFSDTLAAIVPGNGNTWTERVTNPATGLNTSIANKTIPADTLVIYAGGRDFNGPLAVGGAGGWNAAGSQSWFNTLTARGEPGGLASPATDVAPWGGSLSFDTIGTNWHFGKTTAGLSSSEEDFVSVAMHEIGHVFGIGAGNESWTRLIQGGRFTGPKATAENGGVAPAADNSHFAEGVKSDGIEVALDPTLTYGTRKFLSQLDVAAFDDIGWEVNSLDETIFEARHWLTRTGGADATLRLNAAISTSKDVDMYRVYAAAGTTIDFATGTPTSGTPVDTYLRLFDASGAQLKVANQRVAGGTDRLVYNVTRSDYYYVGVSSYGNRGFSAIVEGRGAGGTTGNYRVVLKLAATTQAAGIATQSADYPATTTASSSTSAMYLATLGADYPAAASPISSTISAAATAPVASTKPDALDALFASLAEESCDF